MPRASGRTAPKQAGGLLDTTSLNAFRKDLISFLKLPASFRQRLERLAADPKADRDDVARAYRAMPREVAYLLTYILLLDPDDLSKLKKQLGVQAKDVDDIIGKFYALASHFKGLEDLSEGIVNSWESSDLNVMYDISGEHPSLEFWLFDGAGNRIFYSRSDVADFGLLAERLLRGVADSIKGAKKHGLPINKSCTENVLWAAANIERHCREIRSNLSRK